MHLTQLTTASPLLAGLEMAAGDSTWFISTKEAVALWGEQGVVRRMMYGLLRPMSAHLGFWVDAP
jgi:hypothetical protein